MDMKKQLEANLLKCLQRLHIEYRQRIIQQGSHFSGGGGMIGAKSSGTTAAINSTMHNHDNEITEELFTLIHTINTTVPLPINNHGGVAASSPQGGQSKRQKKKRSKGTAQCTILFFPLLLLYFDNNNNNNNDGEHANSTSASRVFYSYTSHLLLLYVSFYINV